VRNSQVKYNSCCILQHGASGHWGEYKMDMGKRRQHGKALDINFQLE